MDSIFSNGVVEGCFVISPEDAEYALQHFGYKRNRAVNTNTVKYYADSMQKGEWNLRKTDIYFAELDTTLVPPEFVNDPTSPKQVFLVNGQHRLHAVKESNVPLSARVCVDSLTSWDQLKELYSKFDRDNQRNRTIQQMLDASDVYENRSALPVWFQKSTYQAMQILDHKFYQGKENYHTAFLTSSNRRIEMIKDYMKEIEGFFSVISGRDVAVPHKKKISVAPAMAVALVNFRFNWDAADAFWRGVANRSHMEANDPRMVLADFLDEIDSVKAIYRGSDAQCKYFVIYSCCSICWDLFLKHKTVARETLWKKARKKSRDYYAGNKTFTVTGYDMDRDLF